jgi:drug/metabolite transporter (DMT)-like permease
MDFQLGLLLGLAAMLGWGLSDAVAASLSRSMGSFRAFAITRALSLALLLLLIPFFLQPVALTQTALLLVLAMSLFLVVGNLSYYKGFTVGEVSVVSPIAATYPVITVLLSVFLLGESLSALQAFAIGLAIAGSVLTSFKLSDLRGLKKGKPAGGVGYAVLAAASWGFMILLIGLLSNELGWFATILLLNLVTAAFLLPVSGLYRREISLPFKGSLPLVLLLCAFLVIVDTGGALAYSLGATIAPIAIVATVSSIYPIITVLLARAFFRERLSANQGVGIAMVLAALLLLAL